MNLDPAQAQLIVNLIDVGFDKLLIAVLVIALVRANRAPTFLPPAPVVPSPGPPAIPPPVAPPPVPEPVKPPIIVAPPVVVAPPLQPPVVVTPPVVPPTAPVGPSKVLRGKCSYFGGPHDTGVAADEGLALIERSDFGHGQFGGLFLPTQPEGTTGLARALNPDAHYIACRWDYSETSKKYLQGLKVIVKNPTNGKIASDVRPVDWGPNAKTGRVADLSPGLMAFLGLNTDDAVEVDIPLPSGGPTQPSEPITPSAPVAGETVLVKQNWPKQSEALEFFGDPRSAGWEAANLVYVTCPWVLTNEGEKSTTNHIRIHKKCAESLTRVLNFIWEKCGKSQAQIDAFGYNIFSGSYVGPDRVIAGSHTLSEHAYGGALDIWSAENQQGWTEEQSKFKPTSLITVAFEGENWRWGGRWTGKTRDAMHYQALGT